MYSPVNYNTYVGAALNDWESLSCDLKLGLPSVKLEGTWDTHAYDECITALGNRIGHGLYLPQLQNWAKVRSL